MNTKTLKKNVALTEAQALTIMDALYHFKNRPPVELGKAGLPASTLSHVDSVLKLADDALGALMRARFRGTRAYGVFEEGAAQGQMTDGGFVENKPRIIRAESVSLPERRADGMFPPGRATGMPWYRPFKHTDGWWYINTPHGAYPIRDLERLADAAAEAAASKGAAPVEAKPALKMWPTLAGWLGFVGLAAGVLWLAGVGA